MGTHKTSAAWLAAATLATLTSDARAQQFTELPGAFPGAPRWTAGVECADIDLDGDLDVFFADGEGFTGPGIKAQNVLMVNQLAQSGTLSFTDESLARLGPRTSHAKNVTTGDVDSDGYVDALYANAFNTDIPFLYMNRGASQPGFFDFESTSRGFTESFSSSGACFADVDLDGDLDVVISDSGLSFLSGLGDRPRLFTNDGTGVFTEQPTALGAPNKVAHMDVQMADVDGDFDLDFIGTNRANNTGGNHYLLLNDGTGTFADHSDELISDALFAYEMEPADLDGDGDADLFALGLAGPQPGVLDNRTRQGGMQMFQAMSPLAGHVEDSEVAFLDWDNDSDLDVIVGSRATDEQAWRNDGGLVFVPEAGLLPAVGDSTLDLTVGDLDNDGTYDLITTQGQTPGASWANRVFLNGGTVDDVPPVVTAIHDPPVSVPLGDVVVLAKVQDQVLDDGVNYLKARAFSTVPFGAPQATVAIDSVSFLPAQLTVTAGTRVIWNNLSGVDQSVTSTGANSTFDSGLTTDTVEYVFVRPGVYTFTSLGNGATGQVTVTGNATVTEGTYAGGGIFRFVMPDSSFGAGVQLHYELELTDWPGNVTITDSRSVLLGNCTWGNVCQTSPNSLTQGAVMSIGGTTSVSANNMVLECDGLPRGTAGIFYYGPQQVQVPFGEGFRCIGAGGVGIIRLRAIFADDTGHAEFALDFTDPPNAIGVINPGSLWFFQHWYRDVDAGGLPTVNFSDAVRVNFCP